MALGYIRYNQFPSSLLVAVPFVLVIAAGNAAALLFDAFAAFRSFVLNKLWKKFCRTSCWLCPPPPPGLGATPLDEDEGEIGERAELEGVDVPKGDKPAGRTAGPAPDAVLPVLPGASRVEDPRPPPPPPPLSPSPEGPPPDSISLSARSTFGRLKLLLPKGPTMPAEAPAKSWGFLNAPRGSLSDFLAFSS